jgi:hypothetical protein
VDDARAQQVKCDGVLVKPFEPQQVVARVRELVGGAKDKPMPAFAPDAPAPSSSQVSAPAERAATAEPTRKTETKLDDYFQGLDAALAVLDNNVDTRRSMPPESEDFRASEVPTLEKLLGPSTWRDTGGLAADAYAPPIAPSMMDAISGHTRNTENAPATPPGDGGNVILDAFHALLAMEQGEPRPAARAQAPATAPATVTDELVNEVTRRVLERLAPNAARDLVRQVVAEVAERLIREEIARIKAAAHAKR